MSAGWGVIGADFLTPYYDITFSQSVAGFKRRRKTDRYLDFDMLPDRPDEEIIFFGGRDYLRFFPRRKELRLIVPFVCSLHELVG